MGRHNREHQGEVYEMGVSIHEIDKGDVIDITGGNNGILKKVTSISRSGKWDRRIQTESGGTYSMMQVHGYGKKVENRNG